MKFVVNKKLKRKIGLRPWIGSVAGKIWIGIAFALILFGVIIWKPFLDISIESFDTYSSALTITIAVEFGILLLAFFSIVCSYRQLTRFTQMRRREELWIEDNTLFYSYHEKGGWANAADSGQDLWVINLFKIDLKTVKVEFDKNVERLIFKDKINLYFKPWINASKYDWTFIKEVPSINVYNYFEPNLKNILKDKTKERFSVV